jgi:DNA polymerase
VKGLAHHDFETYSAVDLKITGADVYAEHPSTGVHCLAYTLGETDPPVCWYVGQPEPSALLEHIERGGPIACWNSAFEEAIWRHVIPRLYPRWPRPKLEQFHDIMTWAYAAGLPGALDDCGAAMGLAVRKDAAGHRVMLQLAKPRAIGAGGTPSWWHDEIDTPKVAEKFVRLYAYCAQDVAAERAIAQRLRPLTAAERRVWLLDRRINQRGVLFDDYAADGARRIAKAEADRLNAEMRAATSGAVKSCTDVAGLVQFVRDYAIPCEGIAKGDVRDLLAKPDLPPEVAAALRLRQEAGKASTAKLTKMLAGRSRDGRARDLFQYHGASTGRWAGRRVQLQNMPRPELSEREAAECIELFDQPGGADCIRFGYGEPLNVLSWCLRGMLVPAPGHVFHGGDFANIEGRVLSWLAGEHWKLDAFRDYDAKIGPDLYKVAYGRAFNIPTDEIGKGDPRRQIGKVMELSCIAEGQLVTTDAGPVPIEQVTPGMKVWDGVCFVSHKGVIFRGTREVFEYDGLTATADHLVWTEGKHRPVPFGEAATRGERLLRSEPNRSRVRSRGSHIFGSPLHERLGFRLRGRSLPELPAAILVRPRESCVGEVSRVSIVLATSAGSSVANAARQRYAEQVHNVEYPELAPLRRPRHRVPLPFRVGRSAVDSRKSRAAARLGLGPDRQQRTLRTGEPALRHAIGKLVQPNAIEADCGHALLGSRAQPTWVSRDPALSRRGLPAGSYYRAGLQGCSRQAKELARHPTTPRRARVFDIVDAGPRHRFTVSGVLVHNCGYQGGIGAFRSMAKNYNADLGQIAAAARDSSTEEAWQRAEAKRLLLQVEHKQHADLDPDTYTGLRIVVDSWRAAHPAIKGFWADIETCAMEAVMHRGRLVATQTGLIQFSCGKDFLYMRLPSGRVLSYARPDTVFVLNEITKRQQRVLQYWAYGKNRDDPSAKKEFAPVKSYGGLLAENATQAAARDVLVGAMIRMEAAGYPIVLHVHDEARAEVPRGFGSKAECERIMAELPRWAAGLPVAVECDELERYHK